MTNKTERELNIELAELIGLEICEFQSPNDSILIQGEWDAYAVDYCNNANDLEPLIEEYNIACIPELLDYRWRAFAVELHIGVPVERYEAFNATRKRAIVECLIALLTEKNKG